MTETKDSWNLPGLAELEAAAEVVYRHMPATPQYRWPLVDAALEAEVWVKHENHTALGAFKMRGGLVYFDCLRRTHPEVKTVVTATRGNHGQSVGYAARAAGLAAVVVVPYGNSREKNASMRALGVELIEAGEDYQAACEHADRLAVERSGYRLPSITTELVSGVGTYALELLHAVPALDVVYVPVGQGSGICGMMAARAALGLATEIVGVVSSGAPAYQLSFAAGAKVEHAVTTVLADGMACRVPNQRVLELMRQHVTRVIAVDEDEVAGAMREIFRTTHNVAEGAGAASYAGAWQERERLRGKRVGVVLCGGNVDSDVFARVLAGGATA